MAGRRKDEAKGMNPNMTNYKPQLQNYLEREMNAIQNLDLDAINEVMNVLEEARKWRKCGDSQSFLL